MSSNRILQINAASTAACAVGIVATRQMLPALFGLDSPLLLDVLAAGFIAYAGALALAAARQPVGRHTLMAFTIADALWVAGSAVVLLLFWTELSLFARMLIIGVALIVEVFATLQFRAARLTGRSAA
ncbi:MAG: hypothetical protein ACRD1Q_15220 [Vicinamibacterales bacterium]